MRIQERYEIAIVELRKERQRVGVWEETSSDDFEQSPFCHEFLSNGHNRRVFEVKIFLFSLTMLGSLH